MNRLIIICAFLCAFNFSYAQGGRVYTGLTAFANAAEAIHGTGEGQYGYTFGFDGTLTDGFSPFFGASYTSVGIKPSKSLNPFSSPMISFMGGKAGFSFPLGSIGNLGIVVQVGGTLTRVLNYDIEVLKEAYGGLIEEIMVGAGLNISLNYKKMFFAIEGNQHLSNAFSIPDSKYRAFSIQTGLNF